MKFIIQTVDLVEHSVTITVTDHIIVHAGIVVVRIQAPGPHPIPDCHADNTVTGLIQVMFNMGLVDTIVIPIRITFILQVKTIKIRGGILTCSGLCKRQHEACDQQ